ncbi:MAG: ethylbenzene dehydrogenase-related protein [Candidatus Brocadiia bacterium]|nr:ethylbenzene dehydrogenase-related protein [Candidatus Brocadiia bacterium]
MRDANRRVVILTSTVLIVALGSFVFYARTYSGGGQLPTEIEGPAALTVHKLDLSIELEPEGLVDAVWDELPSVTVSLAPQVIHIPWTTSLIPSLKVRAFHNGEKIYFLLEWKDDAESRIHGMDRFPDAAAMTFPVSGEPSGTTLLMGSGTPVDIWEWKADLDAEFWGPPVAEEQASSNARYSYLGKAELIEKAALPTGACQSFIARGPGTLTRKEECLVSGLGIWRDGTWRVIMERPLVTGQEHQDVQIDSNWAYAAFALWDGDEGDRGSRKSISDWVVLSLEGIDMVAQEAGE